MTILPSQPFRNRHDGCIVTVWIALVTVLAISGGETILSAPAVFLRQTGFCLALYAGPESGHRCLNPALILDRLPEHTGKFL